MLKTDILIVTKDRPFLLRACLNSLKKQSFLPNRVIVVDNSFKGSAKKIIADFKNNFKIEYSLEKKHGEAFARNKALKLVKEDILVFIDDDCVADNNWLKNVVNFFQKHSKTDGLVGKTENLLKKNVYANVYQCYYLRWLMENFTKINQAQPLTKEKSFFDTKNVAFRKELVKDFVFDSNVLFHSVNVDNVAGDFLIKKGNFYYYPQMKVYHQNWSSFKELLTKNFYQGIADEWIYQNQKIKNRKKILNYSYLIWLKTCQKEIENLNFFSKINFWLLLFFYPCPYKIGRIFYKYKIKKY